MPRLPYCGSAERHVASPGDGTRPWHPFDGTFVATAAGQGAFGCAPLCLGAAIVIAFAGSIAASGWAEAGLSLAFDGVTHAFAPQMDGARTGFTRFVSVDAVSIEGADGRARLVIELAMPPRTRSTDSPHDVRISFRPDGWRDYWVSPPGVPAAAVEIEHIDLSGPSPRIIGRFALPLCFTPSPIHVPDPAKCLPASGRFDTALVRD